MGCDESTRAVVVNDCIIDETLRYHPALLDWPDNQVKDPLRDIVNCSFWVELLIAGAAGNRLHLGTVDVSSSEEVLIAEFGLVHSAFLVATIPCNLTNLIDFPLDNSTGSIVKQMLLIC